MQNYLIKKKGDININNILLSLGSLLIIMIIFFSFYKLMANKTKEIKEQQITQEFNKIIEIIKSLEASKENYVETTINFNLDEYKLTTKEHVIIFESDGIIKKYYSNLYLISNQIQDIRKIHLIKSGEKIGLLSNKICNLHDNLCDPYCALINKCDPNCYTELKNNVCIKSCVDSNHNDIIDPLDTDGICDPDCYSNEKDGVFDPDCIVSHDNICDPDTNKIFDGYCDSDCLKTDGVCDPDCNIYDVDCPHCGNGICELNKYENCRNCPEDCSCKILNEDTENTNNNGVSLMKQCMIDCDSGVIDEKGCGYKKDFEDSCNTNCECKTGVCSNNHCCKQGQYFKVDEQGNGNCVYRNQDGFCEDDENCEIDEACKETNKYCCPQSLNSDAKGNLNPKEDEQECVYDCECRSYHCSKKYVQNTDNQENIDDLEKKGHCCPLNFEYKYDENTHNYRCVYDCEEIIQKASCSVTYNNNFDYYGKYCLNKNNGRDYSSMNQIYDSCKGKDMKQVFECVVNKIEDPIRNTNYKYNELYGCAYSDPYFQYRRIYTRETGPRKWLPENILKCILYDKNCGVCIDFATATYSELISVNIRYNPNLKLVLGYLINKKVTDNSGYHAYLKYNNKIIDPTNPEENSIYISLPNPKTDYQDFGYLTYLNSNLNVFR